MRKQTRLTEPAALIAKKQIGTENWITRRNAWRANRALGQEVRAPTFSWPDWNKVSVYYHILPVLRQQTDDHCSFCDAFPVQGVSIETIEHFYPKTDEAHEHRVLEWTNLFYACTACQAAKNDRFHSAILKPDEVDYSFNRYFRFDFTLGKILPLAPEDTPEYEMADETIKHYGLNDHGRPRNRLLAKKTYKPTNERELADCPYRDFVAAGYSED